MKINPVDQTNLMAAAEVHGAAWRESHREICSPEFVAAHTAQRQAEYLKKELKQGKRLFLLTDGDPVGVVSVWGDLIENLYVHPEQQGRGYGTALLTFAEGRCKTPRLWVLNTNEQARRFYEKRGYKLTGRETILSGTLKELEMGKSRSKAPTP